VPASLLPTPDGSTLELDGSSSSQRSHGGRRALILFACLGLLAAALVLSLAVGSKTLSTAAVLRALVAPDDSETSLIVRELRVPRTVLALVIGAALGLAGTQLQGLTRNPLADPGLLGVSAGAALAVVTTSTVLGVGGPTGQALAALVGALAATVAVWLLAGRGRNGASALPLVLAGVAVTALLSSLTTVLVLLDAETLDEYRFWAVGSVAGRDVALLLPVLPLLAVGLLLAAACASTLDLLALGDDLARGLGARLAWAKAGAVLSATLLTAGTVAIAGPLVFVGLVAPHLARPLVGAGHRWLLPTSAVLGALLLLVSDVVGRVVARPGEVQVGIVTAVVGAPVLVALVSRRRVSRA
jgi:iron complex transport system permease protein